MDRIQLRRDTSANWASANPILLEGEPGYETDTKLRKIGDGVSAWNDLPYLKAEGITQELGNNENLAISQDLFTKLHNEGYKFAGIANLDTIPQNVTADSRIYYIANIPGTYTNFNNLAVADGEIAFLTYNGVWSKNAISGVVTDEKLSNVTEKLAELESETESLSGKVQIITPTTSGSGTVTLPVNIIEGNEYSFTNNGRDSIYLQLLADDDIVQAIGTIAPAATKTIKAIARANGAKYYKVNKNHTITVVQLTDIHNTIQEMKDIISQHSSSIVENHNSIGRDVVYDDTYIVEAYDDGGTWVSGQGFNGYAIPPLKGAIYTITANAAKSSIISFVKEISQTGDVIYANGEQRRVINAGVTKQYECPTDANFIYVARIVESADRLPQSLIVETAQEQVNRKASKLNDAIISQCIDLATLRVLKFNDSGEVYANKSISTTRRFHIIQNANLSICQLSEDTGIEVRINWYSPSLKMVYQTGWQKFTKGKVVAFTTRNDAAYFSISYRKDVDGVYDETWKMQSDCLYVDYPLKEMNGVYCLSKDAAYPKNVLVDFVADGKNYEVTLYLKATESNQYLHLMDMSRTNFMVKQMKITPYDVALPYTFTIFSETINPLLIARYNGLACEGIEIKEIDVVKNHRIVDYAHLGYGAYFPYNTISGFVAAIKAGFKGIVANVVETSDGELMCYHDNDKMLTNDNGATFISFTGDELRTMTSAELRGYDAGLVRGESFKGEKVPFVKDVIRLCANNGVLLCFSIHPNLSDDGWNKLYGLLARAGMLEHTTIKSFDPSASDGSYPNFTNIYPIFGDKVRYGFDCELSKSNVDYFASMELGSARKLIETALSQLSTDNEDMIGYAIEKGLDVSIYDVYAAAGGLVQYAKLGVTEITSDNFVVAGSWIYE